MGHTAAVQFPGEIVYPNLSFIFKNHLLISGSFFKNTKGEVTMHIIIITPMLPICLQPEEKPGSYTNTGLYKII